MHRERVSCYYFDKQQIIESYVLNEALSTSFLILIMLSKVDSYNFKDT